MVQVLLIARTLGVLNLGNIALDGSKIKANASKHSAMSYGHIKKLEEQLGNEVKKLMALAEAADNEKIPAGLDLPDEVARREDRLKAIACARTKIEERAKERHGQEQAEYEAKLAKREAKATDSGKKPRGKPPVPPVEGARDKDQINLTDEESRIMKRGKQAFRRKAKARKVSDGGFDQCYNSQIAVDMDGMLIVATNTVQACNDKQQVEPILEQFKALPVELGKPDKLLGCRIYLDTPTTPTKILTHLSMGRSLKNSVSGDGRLTQLNELPSRGLLDFLA